MGDPVIEWYDGSGGSANQITSHDYGTVDAGSESTNKKFWVWNNKGGTGASTAESVQYTTFDNSQGDETQTVVTEKWLEVKKISDNGSSLSDSFSAVGGSADADKKDLPNIENDTYVEIDTKVVVPSDASAGQQDFVQRVEYKFT